ncbi:hypothetical protein E4U43_006770, partial [Claviceps pusilla]
MALTIPTPEGPLKSITFLGDRMDWPAWYDDVTDIAQALDIWKYVNPDSQHDLREPARPSLPTRPVLKSVVQREPFETDKMFDARLRQEQNAHALAVSEYDVLCQQFRIDTRRYVAALAEHAAARDHLQQLYRIIFRSIPDRYRAYLKLDAAKTPRAMILSLRGRITPPSDKDRAHAALRTYNSRLNVQPTDDKQSFVDAIAVATVELHRFKGDGFDEGTAVKDLLRSLQLLDEEFADIWLRKEGRRAVLDIVEDFKHKLRREDGKGVVSGHQQEQQWGNHISNGKVSRPKSASESVGGAPSISTAVNGNHNGRDHDDDSFAPSRSTEHHDIIGYFNPVLD